MADKQKAKFDKNGDLIVARRKPQIRVSITRVARENAGGIVTAALGGAVATGVGMGLVRLVPPLRRFFESSGVAGKAVAVTGASMVAAGVGLAVLGKVSTPKRALMMAPWVLGGTAVMSFGPVLAQFVVSKVESLVSGIMPSIGAPPAAPQLPQGGQGPVPRRVLTPQEVQLARQVRGGQQGYFRRWR